MLGAAMLVYSETAASTLLVAYMTPVGVCALLDRWIMGLATATILGVGYAGSLLVSGKAPAAELAVSNVAPGFVIVFGAVIPIRLLLLSRREAAEEESPAPAVGVLGAPGVERGELEPGHGPVALLIAPPRPRRGRKRGERPRHVIARETNILALLTAPGPVPTPQQIAFKLGTESATIYAHLRAMRAEAGFARHDAWVASLRTDRARGDD